MADQTPEEKIRAADEALAALNAAVEEQHKTARELFAELREVEDEIKRLRGSPSDATFGMLGCIERQNKILHSILGLMFDETKTG